MDTDFFDESVSLSYEQRRKSRFRVNLQQHDMAWFLPRGQVLHNGTVLICEDGYRVQILAADEQVSQVTSEDTLLLTRLAYHLGNRHVSLQIGENWLRYMADYVLDEMVHTLGGHAQQMLAPFDPEDGAYHSHAHEH